MIINRIEIFLCIPKSCAGWRGPFPYSGCITTAVGRVRLLSDPSQVSITSQFQLKPFLENSRIPHLDGMPDITRTSLLTYFNNYRCHYFEWMDADFLSPSKLGNAVRLHYEKNSALLGYKQAPTRHKQVAYLEFLQRIGATEKAAALKQVRSFNFR